MSIIPFDPAEIVEIKLGDLSAPVAAGVEMSKLYLAADEIVRKLIHTIHDDEETGELIIPRDLLPWYKEQRFLLSEIYKMTGEVEEKTALKKLELQTAIYKQLFKDMTQADKIKMLKVLKNKEKSKIQVV